MSSFRVSILTIFIACLPGIAEAQQMNRLALIEVDSTQLPAYNEFLKDEIITSVDLEPGVRTLYAVAKKSHRTSVIIFETYADSGSYLGHLKTKHFLKYKNGTSSMVRKLQLIEGRLIFNGRKPITPKDDAFIRVIQLEIDSLQTENYFQALEYVLQQSSPFEPGILVMYGVAEKSHPERVTVLEVYDSPTAAEKHLESSQYRNYKNVTNSWIKSRQVTDAIPIALRAKD